MRRSVFAVLLAVAGAGILGCRAPSGAATAAAPAATRATPTFYGQDLAPVAPWINPCDDFEGFACEGRPTPWIRLRRPGDPFANQPELMLRFADEVVAGQHREFLAKTPLLRDYLVRCRDPVARNAGIARLKDELDAVARVATLEEWARSLASCDL